MSLLRIVLQPIANIKSIKGFLRYFKKVQKFLRMNARAPLLVFSILCLCALCYQGNKLNAQESIFEMFRLKPGTDVATWNVVYGDPLIVKGTLKPFDQHNVCTVKLLDGQIVNYHQCNLQVAAVGFITVTSITDTRIQHAIKSRSETIFPILIQTATYDPEKVTKELRWLVLAYSENLHGFVLNPSFQFTNSKDISDALEKRKEARKTLNNNVKHLLAPIQ